MATLDPFDIRKYEQIGPGKGVIDADTLARANRARRVAQFGEEAVERMERAGRTFGGGVDGRAPRTAPGGSPNPPAGGGTARPAAAPRPTAPRPAPGILRRVAGAAGKVALPIAAGVAAFDAAQDTPDEREAFLRKLGLEEKNDRGQGTGYFSDSARYFGGIARGVNSFAFGLPERIIDKFQGRGFFRPDDPVAATVPGAGTTATNGGPQPEIGFVPPTSSVVSPVTDPAAVAASNAFIDSSAVPARGTGFIRNNQTGAIQQFDARSAAGAGVSDEQPSVRRIPGTGIPVVDAILTEALRQAPGKAARSNVKARTASTAAEAALVKAYADANKPDTTKVIDPLLPGENPRVVSVAGGVARELPVVKGIPAGQTRESMIAFAKNDVKNGITTTEGALNALREFGISLDKL